jgi:hypothetical protein
MPATVDPPVHARDLISSARAQTAAAYRRLADAATVCASILDDPTSSPADRQRQQSTVIDRSHAVKSAEEYFHAVRAGAARIEQAR